MSCSKLLLVEHGKGLDGKDLATGEERGGEDEVQRDLTARSPIRGTSLLKEICGNELVLQRRQE